jgi:hypothetical protein
MAAVGRANANDAGRSVRSRGRCRYAGASRGWAGSDPDAADAAPLARCSQCTRPHVRQPTPGWVQPSLGFPWPWTCGALMDGGNSE